MRPVVDQIVRFGEIRRGWLGVRLANLNRAAADRAGYDGSTGAVVTRITPNGPAARAGLRAGDVVLRFNGQDIADSRGLTRLVGEAEVGANVVVDIVREGRRMQVTAHIERLEETDGGGARVARSDDNGDTPRRDGGPRGGRIFGIALSELDASLREEFQIEPAVQGLVVLAVDVGAENEGVLRAGDVIEAIGPERTDTIAAARAIAGRAAIGEHAIVARINREGAVTYRRLQARS
ncbi:MAG: PDZ domain-containing protein [Terricaulis sp.]